MEHLFSRSLPQGDPPSRLRGDEGTFPTSFIIVVIIVIIVIPRLGIQFPGVSLAILQAGAVHTFCDISISTFISVSFTPFFFSKQRLGRALLTLSG